MPETRDEPSPDGEGGSDDTFHHASADEGFKSRVDSIFGCLGSLEKKYEDNVPKEENIYSNEDNLCQTSSSISHMAQRMYHKRGRGGRGRGRGRGRVPNKVPDHVLNPEKWKKYRLVIYSML